MPKREVAMPVELSREEKDVLVGLLEREIEEIRTEIRHTRTHDYKDSLKEREKILHDLLGRLKL
jgi:ribosome recycling factor